MLYTEIEAQEKWGTALSNVFGDISRAITVLEDGRYLQDHAIVLCPRAYRYLVVDPTIYETVKYVEPHTIDGAIEYLFRAVMVVVEDPRDGAVVVKGYNNDNETGTVVIKGAI